MTFIKFVKLLILMYLLKLCCLGKMTLYDSPAESLTRTNQQKKQKDGNDRKPILEGITTIGMEVESRTRGLRGKAISFRCQRKRTQ